MRPVDKVSMIFTGNLFLSLAKRIHYPNPDQVECIGMSLSVEKSSSLLDRRISYVPFQNLSAGQLQMDALHASFQQEASHFSNLLAMAGGGLAYKVVRSSLLSAGSLRSLAVLGGLGSEVTFYRAATNLSQAGLSVSENVFDASGWANTFLNFGILKGVGRMAQGHSAIIVHSLQSSAMVAGNQLAYRFEIGQVPEGTLLDQLLHAETTNLAMIGGNSLLAHATGNRLHAMERSFDLRAQLTQTRALFRNASVSPVLMNAAEHSSFEGSSLQLKLNPVFEFIRQGADAAKVAEALQKSNILLEDVQAYVDFSNPEYAKTSYGRTQVYADSGLEALVMGWRPGQYTCGHDHRASDGSPVSVAETAVQGRVGEIRFEKAGMAWREVGRSLQNPGQVMAGGEGLYHLIFNAGKGNMITLHLYWPPLDMSRTTQFTVDSKNIFPRPVEQAIQSRFVFPQQAWNSVRERLAPYAVPALAIASMWQGMSTGWALLAGLGVAVTVGNPYSELSGKAVKPLLAASLIGLGAGMDLNAVARAGIHGVGYTLGGITLTLGLGKLLSRVSGVERNQRRLIDCGTAICGGSAIAAITQTLGLKPKDPAVSVALGTVFTLNSLALFLFPMIGHKLNMSQHDFGLWSALAIHDTSSVVGAASAYGPQALETATTVKLARALWIIPLALGMNAWDRRSQTQSENPASRPVFPKFILGFLAAAAATTFIPELKPAGDFIAHRSQETMRLTLFLLGANMNMKALRSVGPRPFLHGTTLWLAMGGLTLLGIEQGWID